MLNWLSIFGGKKNPTGDENSNGWVRPNSLPVADDIPEAIRDLQPMYHAVFRLAQKGKDVSEISIKYGLTEKSTHIILSTIQQRLGRSLLNESKPQNPALPLNPPQRPASPTIAPPLFVDRWNGSAYERLCFGRKSNVSFHRTLRVPEDGKDYPLPAGLGMLPIHRIEDYAETVPEKWLEDGGFFVPLYQREALFLEFEGDSNRPMISKVCVGEINAISGQAYSESLSAHKQDYVVIPSQKWLDGINNGNGIVRQFVAMPLGQGYTVEEQVTDEKKHEGFQLVVYDAVEGYFADPQMPVSKMVDIIVAACKRRFELKLERCNLFEKTIVSKVREGGYTCAGVAHLVGLDEKRTKEIYKRFLFSFLREVVKATQDHLGRNSDTGEIQAQVFEKLRSLGLREEIDPEPETPCEEDAGSDSILRSSPSPTHSPGVALYSSPTRPYSPEDEKEMGIAAGGSIEQQIHPDTYGVDSWDENRRRTIKIHIINSESYAEITGLPAPHSPVTADNYQKAGIPWFSSYDESVKTLGGAAAFKRIQGVDKIDQHRGIKPSEPRRSIEVGAHQIERIKTPTLEEVITDLRSKAHTDVDSEKWKSAILKIDYLFDLGVPPTSYDYSLRSLCNYHIGRCLEGIIDADFALAKNPTAHLALQSRARCRITLGDFPGGREDGEALASILGNESVGAEIMAEASYHMGDYEDAAASAQKACEFDPQNSRASEIAVLAKSGPAQ